MSKPEDFVFSQNIIFFMADVGNVLLRLADRNTTSLLWAFNPNPVDYGVEEFFAQLPFFSENSSLTNVFGGTYDLYGNADFIEYVDLVLKGEIQYLTPKLINTTIAMASAFNILNSFYDKYEYFLGKTIEAIDPQAEARASMMESVISRLLNNDYEAWRVAFNVYHGVYDGSIVNYSWSDFLDDVSVNGLITSGSELRPWEKDISEIWYDPRPNATSNPDQSGTLGNPNIVTGTNGDDRLQGSDGFTIFDSKNGNDNLQGKLGDDLYLFYKGGGTDTISEIGGTDTVYFGSGIKPSDLEFTRSADDLVISILGTEDKVIFSNWFYSVESQVETVAVGNYDLSASQIVQMLDLMYGLGRPSGIDGAWSKEQLAALNRAYHDFWDDYPGSEPETPEPEYNVVTGTDADDLLNGTTGDDIINGGSGDDTLSGNAGNDRLDGGAGDDVYVWRRGDGNDVISENEDQSDAYNIVDFGDISFDDVEFLIKKGDDGYSTLVIKLKDTGETLTLENVLQNSDSDNPHGIQAFMFADRRYWLWELASADKRLADGETYVEAPSDSGLIKGNALDNTIIGGIYDDYLYGEDGNDVLHGGAEYDSLYGGSGNRPLLKPYFSKSWL